MRRHEKCQAQPDLLGLAHPLSTTDTTSLGALRRCQLRVVNARLFDQYRSLDLVTSVAATSASSSGPRQKTPASRLSVTTLALRLACPRVPLFASTCLAAR